MNYKLQVSNELNDFLDFVANAISMYNYCKGGQTLQEQITQDLLHKLELDNVSRNEQARITTQIKHCRKDRRYYKDRCEELAPLIEIFDDPKWKEIRNRLQSALGHIRRVEKYHADRKYVPKVMRQ